MLKKGIALVVIVILISISVVPSIGRTVDKTSTMSTSYNGSLSGYVNDTSLNPIEGARVRVYFHGTYEENFTDSSGYYKVTNIPICYCLKNCTASKEGYNSDWVWLGIAENTTYDFVLMPFNSPCYPVLNGTIGWNGWFVSCVKLSFFYDPEKISEIYFQLDSETWQIYSIPFDVCEDFVHKICWKYIDNEGNQSAIYCKYFLIDQTKPQIDLTCEAYKENGMWYIIFNVTAEDECSSMNKVEFYINDKLETTIYGPGPIYLWELPWFLRNFSVFGLICNRRFTDENVSFFALIVKIKAQHPFNGSNDIVNAKAFDNAGNWAYDEILPGIPPSDFPIIFKHFSFINNYKGYIGRFLINAVFENVPIKTVW